jgi:hypothetical protein
LGQQSTVEQVVQVVVAVAGGGQDEQSGAAQRPGHGHRIAFPHHVHVEQ